MESLDLQSKSAVEAFAKTWEEKGAIRRGALNEEIGRTAIAGFISFPSTIQTEPDYTLHLFKTLLPSFIKTATAKIPDPLLSALSTEAQIRLIRVVDSPLYAGASARSLLTTSTLNEKTPAMSAMWTKARASLYDMVLWREAHARLITRQAMDARICCLTVSTGLTTRNLFDLLSPSTSASVIVAVFSCSPAPSLTPLIWFVGKSNTEAVRDVEWALLASAAATSKALPVVGIVGGGTYRQGKEVGCVLLSLLVHTLAEAWSPAQNTSERMPR